MKRIKLTQDKETIVDDEDYEYLRQWSWYYHNGYAIRSSSYKDNPKRHEIKLHNELMNAPKNYYVDHINGDPLDNRKDNLRIATHQQNCFNRGRTKEKNRYKGVSWHKAAKKYTARITLDGKTINLGCFEKEIEAAKCYNEAAIKYHGQHARINKL